KAAATPSSSHGGCCRDHAWKCSEQTGSARVIHSKARADCDYWNVGSISRGGEPAGILEQFGAGEEFRPRDSKGKMGSVPLLRSRSDEAGKDVLQMVRGVGRYRVL